MSVMWNVVFLLNILCLMAFPDQCRDIISPLQPRPAPGPPLSWTCLEHLPRKVRRRHPYQMPKPPQHKGAAALLRVPQEWLRCQPPSWGNPLQPFASAILFFWSWSTLHDHGWRKEQRLTNGSRALPFSLAPFLSPWCGKTNAKLLPLYQFSCQKTTRYLKSFTWRKVSFPTWNGQFTGFLLRNMASDLEVLIPATSHFA